MQPLFDIPEVILHTFTEARAITQSVPFFSSLLFHPCFLWTCVGIVVIQAQAALRHDFVKDILELLRDDGFIFRRAYQGIEWRDNGANVHVVCLGL